MAHRIMSLGLMPQIERQQMSQIVRQLEPYALQLNMLWGTISQNLLFQQQTQSSFPTFFCSKGAISKC